MNGSDPKLSARELLEEAHPALVGLSHWIHANPEIGFEETLASGWVAEWLVTGGFEVETRRRRGCPRQSSAGPGPVRSTSPSASSTTRCPRSGMPAVTTSSRPPASARASRSPRSRSELGLRVTVLGTPAEETGGGKLRLIDAGAFDGVHAAMMVHPVADRRR